MTDPTTPPRVEDLPLFSSEGTTTATAQRPTAAPAPDRVPSGPVFDALAGPRARRETVHTIPTSGTSPAPGSSDISSTESTAAPDSLLTADSEFWSQVRALRGDVASRLTRVLNDRPGIEVREREERGRDIIQQVVQDHSHTMLDQGAPGLSDRARARLTRALFDAMFRLGRLQPLLDRQDVENIEITGYDHVVIEKTDGSCETVAPVAESDDDLISFLQFLAARDPHNEHTFTRSSYQLEMALPGRARLAAIGWVVPRPRVTIRLQRLKSVDLSMLRHSGTIDSVLEQFLTAAVQARRTIVVSGRGQGSGKTTLLRALCRAMEPWESVATIETDYELYLHEEPEHHHRVVPMQARRGAGEPTPTGTRAGQVTTRALMHDALRHNIRRIIVGEVRGPEIVAMFEAMQAGNGSMSTVHADNARDVVERLAGMAAADATLSETYAYRQVAQSIDLIVYLNRDTHSNRRYVSQIIQCTRGEAGNPVAVTDIFVPGPDGRAIPMNAPTFIDELEAHGFDRNLLNYRSGTWEDLR